MAVSALVPISGVYPRVYFRIASLFARWRFDRGEKIYFIMYTGRTFDRARPVTLIHFFSTE